MRERKRQSQLCTLQHFLDAAHDFNRVESGKIWHQYINDATTLFQGVLHPAVYKATFFYYLLHSFTGARRHIRSIIQDARDGGDRNPCFCRNLCNGPTLRRCLIHFLKKPTSSCKNFQKIYRTMLQIFPKNFHLSIAEVGKLKTDLDLGPQSPSLLTNLFFSLYLHLI